MSLSSFAAEFAQLCFDFVGAGPQKPLPPPPVTQELDREDEPAAQESSDDDLDEEGEAYPCGADEELVGQCRQMLLDLGMKSATDLVQVHWNPRLRSTAGYARYPSWRIELNPRLRAFEGQVDRTLRHELAHLVAYHRAGRRRIEPHGYEWQQACADLGIPGEPAHHHLPLPRTQRQRPHAYQCPACLTVVRRVRPFKRATACLSCCRRHAGGQFDTRFKFVKVTVVVEAP
jgi:predicted SprT family Zn-dependent metalloprotease